MTNTIRLKALIAAIAVAVSLSAAAAAAAVAVGNHRSDPFGYLRSRVTVREPTGADGVFASTLANALPNVEVSNDLGMTGRFSTRLVDGSVSDVAHGRGFVTLPDSYDPTEGALGTPQPVGFDDPTAQWRELLVTLATDSGPVTLTWVIDGPMTLYGTRGLNPDPDDPDQMAAGIKTLGHVLVLVDDRDGIAEMTPAHTLTVADDDQLNTPFRTDRQTWLGQLTTRGKAKAEAAKSKHTIAASQS